MDRTEEFAQSVLSHGGTLLSPRSSAASKRNRVLASFDRTARECHAKITRVSTFLADSMGLYADFDHGMTDAERDKVDELVSEALTEVETAIGSLEKLTAEQQVANAKDHQRGVAMLLLDALRGVQESANGARSLRQRHVLAAREKLCSVVTTSEPITIVDESAQNDLADLDEEELMRLEQENKNLEQHLSTVLEEARRIERNANEFSKMLAMFSEEVLNQHQVIGTILEDAQENVDIVNKVPIELHKASEHGNAFRRFMLGFLLVSGLLLLLLDWMS